MSSLRRQAELVARCRASLNNRNDLTSLIKDEISYAIDDYSRTRFWFNETIFDSMLVTGTREFPVPIDLMHFDKLTLDAPDGKKLDPKNYNLLSNDNATGSPSRFYRYRQSFCIRPITNRDRRIYCHYIRKLEDFEDDLDSNAWTDEAGDLIHARVVGRIMNDRLKEYDQAKRMEGREADILQRLLEYTAARNATGKSSKYVI